MIIGERYGKLTVVSLDDLKATCRCDCGNETTVSRKYLLNGHTKSCGCLRNKYKDKCKPGDKFGKLTVLAEDSDGKVLCRCDCGNTVTVLRYSLLYGCTKSCGCKKRKRQDKCKPGERFGMLTVLSEQDDGRILCRCDCGNTVSVFRCNLYSGRSKACGCQSRNKIKKVYKPGDKYGMLTVLSEQADWKVLCRCDCGNIVSVYRVNLSSGNTKSCGCQRGKKKDSVTSDTSNSDVSVKVHSDVSV